MIAARLFGLSTIMIVPTARLVLLPRNRGRGRPWQKFIPQAFDDSDDGCRVAIGADASSQGLGHKVDRDFLHPGDPRHRTLDLGDARWAIHAAHPP